MPTAKELNPKVTLVVHPGTPAQRALYVAWADWDGTRKQAVTKAREKHATAPLGWLDHATGAVTPVVEVPA